MHRKVANCSEMAVETLSQASTNINVSERSLAYRIGAATHPTYLMGCRRTCREGVIARRNTACNDVSACIHSRSFGGL